MRVFKQTTTGHLFVATPEIVSRPDMREVQWTPGKPGHGRYLVEDVQLPAELNDEPPRVDVSEDEEPGAVDTGAPGDTDAEDDTVALTRDQVPAYVESISSKDELERIGRLYDIELDKRFSIGNLKTQLTEALLNLLSED